ncbi:Abi family protein [Hutsoniella sourekii]
MSKDFKTIEQQIEILISRGLVIDDYDQAYDFLYPHNYYRISGYTLTLRKNDQFYPNVSMENVMTIYYCDQEMRHILLKYLEQIETKVKSIYAYEFCKTYHPLDYLNATNFNNPEIYHRIMQKAEQQKQKNYAHEAYIKHYTDKLKEDMPLWAYIDLFTISDLSFLIKISDKHLKENIASGIGIYASKSDQILERFMHSLTILRNLSAHGSRLYNRLFQQKPWLNKHEKSLLIKKNGQIDNAHLYSFIIVMRRILSTTEFRMLKFELISLFEKYPFVDISHYGFRDDWIEKL